MNTDRIADRLDPAEAMRRMVLGPDGKIDVDRMTMDINLESGEVWRRRAKLAPGTELRLVKNKKGDWGAIIRRGPERQMKVYGSDGFFDTPEEALEALLEHNSLALGEIMFGAETKIGRKKDM